MAVDKCRYLVESGAVPVRRVDHDRGYLQRDSVEFVAHFDCVGVRSGMRAPQWVFAASLVDSGHCDRGLDFAVHDSNCGDTAQRLESGAPQPILKRCLGHDGNPRSQ